MELKTMMTRTVKTTSPRLRGLKLAALAIGTSFVLAGCAGNPPSEQYAVTQSAVNNAVSAGANPDVTESVYRAMIAAFIEQELTEHQALAK